MDKNQLKLIQSTLNSKLLPNFIVAPILAIMLLFIGELLGYILFSFMESYISNPALSMSLIYGDDLWRDDTHRLYLGTFC